MRNNLTIKNLTLIASLIFIAFVLSSCGGGAGSLDPIGGQNPGTPSKVELAPSSFIAQTNGFITFNAKILDGNGKPIPNIAVHFTNLSSIGVLDKTVAYTNSDGIALANLYSTTPGFATILAQVYTGAGQVRDRRTVFFTVQDVLRVSMDMDVNSVPGNTIFNELSDFTLFETSEDDTFEVLATVRDAGGLPVGGGWGVTWSRSHTEATWVRTETSTNVFGQAKAVIKVEPASIRNTETHLNIAAFAENGAANMVTLFLGPVVPDPTTSYLTANPPVVDRGGTSTITAVVMLNTGSRAPDGTTVNFRVTCDPNDYPGLVTPFAQTTGGVATATFTAPPVPAVCTITARVAGVTIGTVNVTVRAPLAISPASMTLCLTPTSTCPNPGNFEIIGGVAPFTLNSSNTTIAIVEPTTTTGRTFTVRGVAAGPATITVRDSLLATATATITVIDPP
jgi:hypothetical protein